MTTRARVPRSNTHPLESDRGHEVLTVTISGTTIADQFEAHSDIGHGDGFPHPAPVPDRLDTDVAAVEGKTLRCELLTASFQTNATTSEGDVSKTATAAVFCKHADLFRASLCDQLHILCAGCLSHLVMYARHERSGRDLADIDDDIANLSVEVGSVDVVSV